MVGGTALSSSKHKQEGERRQGKNLRILRTQFCCWLRKQRGKTRPASKRPHIDHWAFSSIHKTRGETAILSTKRGIVLLNSTELTGFIDRLEYLGRKYSGIILSIPGDVYGAVHAGNWRPKSCGIVRPDFRDGTGGKSPVGRPLIPSLRALGRRLRPCSCSKHQLFGPSKLSGVGRREGKGR